MKKAAGYGRFSERMRGLKGALSGWMKLLTLVMVSASLIIGGVWGTDVYGRYIRSIPANTTFWGHDFSDLNATQARSKLIDMIKKEQYEKRKVVFQAGFDEYERNFFVAEMEPEYLVDETLLRLFEGYSLPEMLVQGELNVAKVVDRIKAIDTLPQDAQWVLDEADQQWKIHPSQTGFRLGVQAEQELKEDIRRLVLSGEFPDRLEIQLESMQPRRTYRDLEPFEEEINKMLEKEIVWFLDGQKGGLRVSDYPWLIEIDIEGRRVDVSRDGVAALIRQWAKQYDREPGQGELTEPTENDKGELRVSYKGDVQMGRRIVQEQAVDQLRDALLSDLVEAEPVELAFETLLPTLRDHQGRELALLSQGRSSYSEGNSENRVYNVAFGLQKYDGLVIPEGAEFSFNDVLGWVTYEAGWKPALAIFGGGGVRPVPGGGLCQVSTTMYRAAVHSGLPVLQRKPHSLDVSYYHAYGDGIDSTIYPPEDIDLRFVNDTPGDIVMRAYVDAAREEAFVEFYGVHDGRQIELAQTINRPVHLPGEVTYTDEIPTGLQEVLHRGRVGRYVQWAWNITRADGSVEERVIDTLYEAERRKVRVGTGSTVALNE